MRHGKNDKLAIFIPESDGMPTSLFYITLGNDKESALIQGVDLSKTKDLERPIAGACVLSVVPLQAISNEAAKPSASQASAPVQSEESAPTPAPAPAPAPVASTGSAE